MLKAILSSTLDKLIDFMLSIPEESFIWFLNAGLFYSVGVGFIILAPVRETIEIILEWCFLVVFIGSYSVAMVIYFERD